MIEMLEGVPGSGKSYYAVSERLLKWVRAGRRVYVYVEGFYLDRLALFEGVEQAELEKQITLWMTGEAVRSGLLQVEPGSAVIIDEAQTIFRSREKVEPELLRMLETHRHKGLDIVMLCQQHGQMTLGVLRLVEVTTKFRRLDRFGLKDRYQAQVRGNPEETEVIRMFTGTVFAEGVCLLLQLCACRGSGKCQRREHLEKSDGHSRNRGSARGGRVVCLGALVDSLI